MILTPIPADMKPRKRTCASGEGGGTTSLDTAFRILSMFGMLENNAHITSIAVSGLTQHEG